ncbi:uncharacterized protein SAPINGB_P000036 [Magnusiomyces paraingens]|uniref:Uncharacterized protein n=1 Tax=Magnusiomyces paraingens TaxID=2606893 RepID=A0A5E8AY71_9ASCO|nr:uncharacterized protein SAPINGB_P000036 [Saprochaete ingens]VVT43549.1 unnamed protein product [Saprochaete ingens]
MSSEYHQEKKMKTTNLKIGTHSGTFHADESLAVFMLKLLPKFSGAEVVRSRTPEILDECDIVVDVSGKYDGEKYFDHHQREFEGVFGEGYKTKLSSAGLVYKHFGQDILASVLKETKESAVVQQCFPRIYKIFIEAIDANDNGISVYNPAVVNAINEDENVPYKLTERFISNTITLPAVVSRCNPRPDEFESSSLDENAIYDSKFQVASEIMGNAFLGIVLSTGKDWFPSKTKVSHYYNTREDPRVLILDTFVAWKSHIFDIEKELTSQGKLKDEDKLLYIVYPGSDSWRVQAVPMTSSSFVSRKPLPEAWRGVRDEALSKVTGIDGCVFVHASGFIGGNKTKEGAVAMVKKALEL